MVLCKNPWNGFACGQCLPCRINRRRIWTHRILLEATQHVDNTFITLTYDEQHLPEGGHVNPEDLRKFWNRLRKAIYPARIRYYAVGEYGTDGNRPHYHAAVFGLSNCIRGETYKDVPKSAIRYFDIHCCPKCDVVQRAWGKGNVYLGTLTKDSAGYIAQYVTKGMSTEKGVKYHATKDASLTGLHPEFARMSNRPGIGALAIESIYNQIMDSPQASEVFGSHTDVPQHLLVASKKYPLGRYLTKKLREEVGYSDEQIEFLKEQREDEMLRMFVAEREATEGSDHYEKHINYHKKKEEENVQKIRQIEGRYKLYNKGKKL